MHLQCATYTYNLNETNPNIENQQELKQYPNEENLPAAENMDKGIPPIAHCPAHNLLSSRVVFKESILQVTVYSDESQVPQKMGNVGIKPKFRDRQFYNMVSSRGLRIPRTIQH